MRALIARDLADAGIAGQTWRASERKVRGGDHKAACAWGCYNSHSIQTSEQILHLDSTRRSNQSRDED